MSPGCHVCGGGVIIIITREWGFACGGCNLGGGPVPVRGRERTRNEPSEPPVAAEPQVEYLLAAATKLMSPFSMRASRSSATCRSLSRMCEAVAMRPTSFLLGFFIFRPITGVPPRPPPRPPPPALDWSGSASNLPRKM
eukprot:scaffold83105_cov67-Phaeocystis_antarctica.AAC.6